MTFDFRAWDEAFVRSVSEHKKTICCVLCPHGFIVAAQALGTQQHAVRPALMLRPRMHRSVINLDTSNFATYPRLRVQLEEKGFEQPPETHPRRSSRADSHSTTRNDPPSEPIHCGVHRG